MSAGPSAIGAGLCCGLGLGEADELEGQRRLPQGTSPPGTPQLASTWRAFSLACGAPSSFGACLSGILEEGPGWHERSTWQLSLPERAACGVGGPDSPQW